MTTAKFLVHRKTATARHPLPPARQPNSGDQNIRFSNYTDPDSAYLKLVDEPSVETWELLEAVNADFGAVGALVGIEIERCTPVERLPNAVQATRIVDDCVTAAARAATYAYLAGRRQGKTQDEARRDTITAVVPASVDAAGELLQTDTANASTSGSLGFNLDI